MKLLAMCIKQSDMHQTNMKQLELHSRHRVHRMQPCRKEYRRWQCSKRVQRCTPAAAHQHVGGTAGLPQNWTEVMHWARTKFQAALAPHVADSDIDVARCCLLIALEEEACIEVHPELQELMQQQTHLRPRSAAGAATWSLSRVDALAQQVYQLCCSQELLTAPVRQVDDGSSTAAASTHAAGLQHLLADLDSRHAKGPAANGAEPALPSDTHPHMPATQPRLPAGLFEREPLRVLTAINTVLFEWHGYGPSNRYGNPQDSHLSTVLEGGLGCSPALSILYMQVAARLGIKLAARPLESGRYWVLWPADNPYLLQSISSSSQKPASISNAVSSAVDVSHSAGRHALVIDPYGQGSLLAADEVSELFDTPLPQLWTAATARELLACVLAEMRDAHWARAVGCSAAPGVMLPLNLNTALCTTAQQGQRPAPLPASVNAHAIQRAVAAAEKITWLLPHDSQAQLMFALLLYYARRWDDCWLELGLLLERAAAVQSSAQAASKQGPDAHAAISNGDELQSGCNINTHRDSQGPVAGQPALSAALPAVQIQTVQDALALRSSAPESCLPLDSAELHMVRLLQEKVRLMLDVK